MQYEPIEGENLRVKVDIDHSTFSVYLKKLDITQMSLHKCVDFAQTLLDDVTLEVGRNDDELLGRALNKFWSKALPPLERQVWEALPNYMDMDEESVENWKNKVRDWILTKCTEEDAAAVLNQLRTWRKPRSATIMDNQMYMKKVNSAIPYMSEALDPFDKEEFKRVFFNAHPKPWKDAFLEINGTLDNHSVASITSYMQRKARQAHDKELKNQLHQKIESKKKKRTAGVHHRDDSKPFKKSRINPEENKMDKDKHHKRVAELAKTAKPTEICSLKPNHKNHTISECKAINNYKARMSNKKSNSFAVINLPGDKPDDDSTTSKETNSSNKNA
ncbi:unnamed protein product [Cylindrotheca closterium]|uniref:Uncharacterized protein n=1 Tax=Cylindrotheca closterium TaxID=2856 RepID=A0AAD2FU69_9STRA|nr:unnamed protein product [Cylindrotheca closterium]